MEQVAAGVAGQPHLGEDDDLDAVGRGPFDQTEGAVGVERRVADPQGRDGGGDADETVAGHECTVLSAEC